MYLASMGGLDDKNTLVIWDIPTGKALYSSPVGVNGALDVFFFNKSEEKLVAILKTGI